MMKRFTRCALVAVLGLLMALGATALAEIPGPVENLHVTALGDSWVDLHWDAPVDAGDTPIIYRVRSARNDSAEADDSEHRYHRVSGLTPGEPQEISVFADTAGGEGPDATITVIPGVAAAPLLRATSGDGTLQFDWNVTAIMAGDSVAHYEIDEGEGWEDVGPRTSLYLSGLENDVPMTLKLRAYLSQSSAYSPEATLTASAYVPADPPEAVAIVPGEGRIDVSWQAPPSDGGHPVERYVLSLDSGVTWPYATADADTLSFALDGLIDGELYGLALAAETTAGRGLPYEMWVIPPAPLAPENLTATPGDGEVALAWTPPASEGASPITTYDVCVDPTIWVLVDDVTGYVFPELSNGTLYTFYVRARNVLGTGPYAVVSAMPVGAPHAPSGLYVTAADQGGLTLHWSSPQNDGGSAITGYDVSLGGNTWTDVSDSTHHTFQDAAADAPYTLYARARNAEGTGPSASVQYAPNIEDETPTAPTALTTYPRDGNVYLTWDAPSSDGGNPILYYELSVDGEPWTNVGLANRFTVHGLNNGTSYTFYVRAVNAVGAGPYTQTTSRPGPSYGYPGEPQNPRIAEYGSGFITVAWDPPTDAPPAISYEVSFQRDAGWINIGNVTSYMFTGLVNDMTYTVYIRALNEQGYSNIVYVRGNPVSDNYPPSSENPNIIGPGY